MPQAWVVKIGAGNVTLRVNQVCRFIFGCSRGSTWNFLMKLKNFKYILPKSEYYSLLVLFSVSFREGSTRSQMFKKKVQFLPRQQMKFLQDARVFELNTQTPEVQPTMHIQAVRIMPRNREESPEIEFFLLINGWNGKSDSIEFRFIIWPFFVKLSGIFIC